MQFSFAIPAHDEERLLPRTLDSIHAAARELGLAYEIVVADDASADGTAAVARERGARVISIARRQISAARNAAARGARGEVLIFVDADTLVSARVLQEARTALERGASAGGALIRFDGRVPIWARIMLVSFELPFRLARLSAGCFMFCTRAAFDASGGYDEGVFGGEEVLFALALKRTGRFELLRERVTTSGRKLRAYSFPEVAGTLARAGWRGRRGVRSRAGLDLWYGPRRADPADPATQIPGER